MSWLKIDPIEIKKHPKFHTFRKKLDWQPHHAFGFLCAFWGEVSNTEANESGEISDWTPDYLADRIATNIDDPNRLWEALVPGYIEERFNDRIHVRDWLEIAGPYLRQKYHNTDRDRLVTIWASYGRIYGREHRTQKSNESGSKEGELPSDNDPTSFSIEKEIGEIPAKTAFISPNAASPPRPSSKDNGIYVSLETYETVSKESASENALFGLAETSSENGASVPTPSKALSPITVLQRIYFEKLTKRLHPEKPIGYSFSVAGKVFKDMLQKGLSPTDIAGRFDDWFKSDDTWIVRRAFRITDFPQHFNALKAGPLSNHGGTNGARKFIDGLATANTENEFSD